MLEIKNLSYRADGMQILDDISLSLPEGKLTVITGPNGGGKTTLAKMIAGLNRPSSGQILLDGKDIVPLDVTERAKLGVGYAFQQPVRFKGFTIRELLDIAAGRTLKEDEIKEVLGQVGLEPSAYIDRDVDARLSGGEIKRIEIASVLLRDAKVAIFDEPEAGIDLWSFNSLIRVFEYLRDSRRRSMLIISHQERILSIADEIVLIQGGKLVTQGPRQKLFHLICKNHCDEDCEGDCPMRRGGEADA